MANWDILKRAISDVIKTNGNQEITGWLLQQVLLNIVTNVGANAAFAGVATPTTNPGTPDGPVFYIASEPGVYINFNRFEITDSVIIFKWSNGVWLSEDIHVLSKSYVNQHFTELDQAISNISQVACGYAPKSRLDTLNGLSHLGLWRIGNSPSMTSSQSNYGSVLVFADYGNYVHQMYFGSLDPNTWTTPESGKKQNIYGRSYYNNAWSEWERVNGDNGDKSDVIDLGEFERSGEGEAKAATLKYCADPNILFMKYTITGKGVATIQQNVVGSRCQQLLFLEGQWFTRYISFTTASREIILQVTAWWRTMPTNVDYDSNSRRVRLVDYNRAHSLPNNNPNTDGFVLPLAAETTAGLMSGEDKKKLTELSQNVGDKTQLKTQDKTNLVGAINEVAELVIKTTYEELKALRNNKKLKAGTLYRITDYECTTTQEDTQSAGHKFDIVVQALNEHTLCEEAHACINEEYESSFGYFTDSHLEAWKIMYSLDNDTKRFFWADEENGKGVIYRMVDEWNNDCPYDFKNIQFIRKLAEDGSFDEDGIDVPLYTFNWYNENGKCQDTSIIGNNGILLNDERLVSGVHMNIIKEYYDMYLVEAEEKRCKRRLNNIVFHSWFEFEGGTYYGCNNNIFGYNCFDNTFSNMCSYNSFGSACSGNSFGSACSSNSFESDCYNNSFEHDCHNNSFGFMCVDNSFGDNCSNNLFRFGCSNNSFGYNCCDNLFVNGCSGNLFGNNCTGNSFKFNCYSNSFGDDCYSNLFGSDCYSNSFGDNCHNNSFGSDCHNNSFGNETYYEAYANNNKKIVTQ